MRRISIGCGALGSARRREGLELPDQMGLVGIAAFGGDVGPGPERLPSREAQARSGNAECARASSGRDRGPRRNRARAAACLRRPARPRSPRGPVRRFRPESRPRLEARPGGGGCGEAGPQKALDDLAAACVILGPRTSSSTRRPKGPRRPQSGAPVSVEPFERDGQKPIAPPGRKRTPKVVTGPVGAITMRRVNRPTTKLAGWVSVRPRAKHRRNGAPRWKIHSRQPSGRMRSGGRADAASRSQASQRHSTDGASAGWGRCSSYLTGSAARQGQREPGQAARAVAAVLERERCRRGPRRSGARERGRCPSLPAWS